MTRQEHLDWAKKRAHEYINIGDLQQAMASMTSDLRKHPELQNHKGAEMGLMLQMAGHLSTPAEMRKFIEGFN